MDFVESAFASYCSKEHNRILTLREWRKFTEHLLEAQVLGKDDLDWMHSFWTRARLSGDQEQGISFRDFCTQVKTGFSDQIFDSKVVEIYRELQLASKQIKNLELAAEGWACNKQHAQQMFEVMKGMERDLEEAEGNVKSFFQAQRAFFLSENATDVANSVCEDPRKFLDDNETEIERRCSKLRVRNAPIKVDLHERRRMSPFKLGDKLGHVRNKSLDVTLGKSGENSLVEIVDLRSQTATLSDVEFACHCHAAHRQLLLSSHFPDWMGRLSGTLYFQHFADAVSLKVLLNRFGHMKEKSPIFISTLSQIVNAFGDLVEMTTFKWQGKLSTGNVFLVDEGSRVIIGKVRWKGMEIAKTTVEWLNVQRGRERSLLESLGEIIRDMTGMDKSQSAQLSHELVSKRSEDNEDRIVFSRDDCEKGIRVPEGFEFQIELHDPRSGFSWRACQVSGHQIECVSPDRLIFVASEAGSCILTFKEEDWWKDVKPPRRMSKENEVDDEVFSCQIDVISLRGKQVGSPVLRSIMNSCDLSGKATHNQLRVRDLQARHELLNLRYHQERKEDIVKSFRDFAS